MINRVRSEWRQSRLACVGEGNVTLCEGFLPPEVLPIGLSSSKGIVVGSHRPPYALIDSVLDKLAKHPGVEDFDAWEDKTFRGLVQEVRDNEHLWLYQYSPRTQMFLSLVRELFGPYDCLTASNSLSSQTGRSIRQTMQELVARLKDGLKDKEFQRIERNWRGEAKRREKSVDEYVDALIEKYSKLLVLRLDFYPRRMSLKDANELIVSTKRWKESDFDDLVKDVERLLNNRRSNALFADWVGYVVKFEFAPERGYHAHAIVFLHGHKAKSDSYYGTKIADYWIDSITKGEGTCFCANKPANKRKYRFVGIGMLDHRNAQMRRNLGHVIRYICKSDLHLTTKKCIGQKLLRKGRLKPSPEGRRRGRRRTNFAGCTAARQKS